jgi:hypothetical protein
MASVKDGSQKKSKIKFEINPLWNNIFTLVLFALTVGLLILFKDDTSTLISLFIWLVSSTIFVYLFKIISDKVLAFVSKHILYGNPLRTARNRRKCVEQSWQLVMHVGFAVR